MNSRNNRSIDMKRNHVKNSDFMSILYSKSLREYEKSKFGSHLQVWFTLQEMLESTIYTKFFEIVAILTKKPPTYTIQDEQEVIRGKFYEKELIRVNWVWIHLQSSWFPTHLHSSFRTTRSVHLQISCRSKWIWTDNGGSIFLEFLPIIVPKRYGENLCFTMRNYPKRQRLTILNSDCIRP